MADDKLEANTSPSAGKESQTWFNARVNGLLDKSKARLTRKPLPEIGRMYLYVYDPKWKAILPIYDIFPLTIPIEYYHDGFLGLNLHYLGPMARLAFLSQLMEVASSDKLTAKMKLNLSYELLKNAQTRFMGYKDCIKRYLYPHVRSAFNEVHPKDWGKVVMLPVQNFVIK